MASKSRSAAQVGATPEAVDVEILDLEETSQDTEQLHSAQKTPVKAADFTFKGGAAARPTPYCEEDTLDTVSGVTSWTPAA